jgi:hypothetical protein
VAVPLVVYYMWGAIVGEFCLDQGLVANDVDGRLDR